FYITACSYPFLAVFNACAALLRAQRKSMNTMLSGIISFFLNIAFNALFIFGFKLGIAGVALGTLLARIFPAAFTLYLMTRKSNLVRIKIFEKFRFNGKQLKDILRLGVPSGIENALFQLGKILVLVFIQIESYNVFVGFNSAGDALFANYEASANSVAYNVNTISSIVGNGINTSILTVIGQAVGSGNIGQVKYYIKKMLAISYVGNACCVAVTFALSPVLLNFYDISGEARSIAWKCLVLCLSLQFVTYPLSFGLPAVLKANSDMKFVMVAAVFSMLLMRVGLCYILTCDWVGAHLGAMGLWIGMVADWGLRGLLFGARLVSGKWKKSSGLLNGPDFGEPERIAEEVVAEALGKAYSCSNEYVQGGESDV
ncbi:MAG: polysaccharide biosynthesis C-terminal domain-containing protein, partial [Clostridia bacterium]|nr:polysaccharide biosynthesis C-terminal domain-containing protein [Clostridia bacterium]